MTGTLRLVLDTNVLVSAVMTPEGKARACFEVAFERGRLLLSTSTRGELIDVLYRPELQRYISNRDRAEILARIEVQSESVVVEERIEACQDPKDNKFLEVAVSGPTDFIVTGDEDLLALHPFRGIPILTPAAFLKAVQTRG
jgi:putative PIN family toxin of toxin-antitoxin system